MELRMNLQHAKAGAKLVVAESTPIRDPAVYAESPAVSLDFARE